MTGVGETVRRETLWVAAWTAGLCALMHLVFLLLGKWDWTVLTGSLLGSAAAVGTFFWLAMTVQKAVGRPPQEVRALVFRSHALRLLVTGAALALAFAVPWLNGWAALFPVFFPQIAVRLRPLWKEGMQDDPAPSDATQDGGDALD